MMHMYDPESESSQVEVSTRQRRQRPKRPQNADADEDQKSSDINATSSSRDGVHKIKYAVQSSRNRLSYDVQGNGEVGAGSNRRKKQTRKNINTGEFGDEFGGDNMGRKRPPGKVKSPQRMPRSVSEEVLALEGRFNPESSNADSKLEYKKVRRPRAGQRRERSETEPVRTTFDRPPTGRRPQGARENRKKRKPRSAVFTSGEEDNYQGDMDGEVSEIFHVDKEDIIQSSDLNQSLSKIHPVHSFVAPPTLPSQAQDILYIEKKDGQGFVKEQKNKVKRDERTSYAVQLLEDNINYTTLDFVLKVHLAFRSLALIGHGLLAGLAISQCVFVYTLSDESDTNLLEHYHNLAAPYHSVYYFLLAFSTVSILDRYVNITSGWSQFFLLLLTKPSRALAMIAYFLALVFSVSLAQLDDKISLYKITPVLWTSTDQLSTWKIINLLRVLGAVIGWIMVALAPLDDQTAATIKEAIEKENNSDENGKYEMNSIKSPSIQTWDRIMT